MFFKVSREWEQGCRQGPALQSLPLVQIALENKDRG